MVEEIFEAQSIARFRARARHNRSTGSDFLLSHVVKEMADRLAFVDRKFQNAAITSANADLVSKDFLKHTRHGETIFSHETNAHLNEETLPTSYRELDLSLSFLSLHETNDTPGALVQIRQALRPDGLFMGVLPGGDTLFELKTSLTEAQVEICGGISPRVYPFMDVRAAGALMQRAGFALPVVDSETITVRYSDMFTLMRDLRAMGAVNAISARSRKPTSRSVFKRAAELYRDKFSRSDGKIPATFTFIWLSGWAPDQSQQKPAKRGSATISLKDALKEI